jgi:hypothetical protein
MLPLGRGPSSEVGVCLRGDIESVVIKCVECVVRRRQSFVPVLPPLA